MKHRKKIILGVAAQETINRFFKDMTTLQRRNCLSSARFHGALSYVLVISDVIHHVGIRQCENVIIWFETETYFATAKQTAVIVFMLQNLPTNEINCGSDKFQPGVTSSANAGTARLTGTGDTLDVSSTTNFFLINLQPRVLDR